LLSIVRNTFYTWCRERKEQASGIVFHEEMRSLETDDPHQDDNPEAMLTRSESEEQVRHTLRGLRLEFRDSGIPGGDRVAGVGRIVL
jgi:DNA-directed RNA polymerase specialized sigma24 family protein